MDKSVDAGDGDDEGSFGDNKDDLGDSDVDDVEGGGGGDGDDGNTLLKTSTKIAIIVLKLMAAIMMITSTLVSLSHYTVLPTILQACFQSYSFQQL